VRVRILYLGRLQDVAGTRAAEIYLPEDVSSAEAVRAWLSREEPALGAALHDPSVRIVVNDALARADHPVGPEDEIAFLPAVSGG
jgi:molybdopterin synthase sulfur carrier subunit